MSRENKSYGFQTGPTQTELDQHRRWLEAGNFGFRKKRNCTISVAKTKVLICVFNFAYSKCLFSHDPAHLFFINGFITIDLHKKYG